MYISQVISNSNDMSEHCAKGVGCMHLMEERTNEPEDEQQDEAACRLTVLKLRNMSQITLYLGQLNVQSNLKLCII